jgi:hypothetical protein
MSRSIFLASLILASCSSSESSEQMPAPVTEGVVRIVEPARLEDPAEWSDELDLDIETEFWDLIGNSDHERYPDWHRKVKAYVGANPDAHPRIALYLSAGAVFTLTQLFQSDDIAGDLPRFAEFIDDATSGARAPASQLTDREPALVFYHNNQAMLAFLLRNDADLGICHLEKLRNLEDNPDFLGTEGRAAAPFTYAMVNDEAYVDYAIEMMEGCENQICMWTSKLSPFKPIGQILTLAEFHGIKAAMATTDAARDAQLTKMNELLDRAAALGEERDYPFMDRIEEIRTELPTRTYTDGMGLGRAPMPIYSNETNCGGCHMGGIPGTAQEPLDDPYPGAEVVTEKPGPPPFKTSASVDCDL